MRTSLFLSFLVCSALSYGQGGKEPVKVSDMLRIKQPGNVQLSPDGASAFFTLTSIEPEADKKWEYQYQTQLWTVPTDGSAAPRQLTAAKEGAAQPALSPDGSQLAFVRQVDGRPQIFLLSLKGGEPLQLTRYKYGAGNPRWSPDGKSIAFVSAINWRELANDSSLNPGLIPPSWSTERPGIEPKDQLRNSSATPDPDGGIAEARAWLQQNEKDKRAKVINRLQFQEESSTNGEMTISHVFIVPAQAGSQPRQVTKGINSFSNPQFLSNTQLLVEGESDFNTHPDRVLASAIYRVNTDGSGFTPLLQKKDYNYGNAVVSATGKWIAFSHGPVGFVTIPSIGLIPANGTEKDFINIPYDRNRSNLTFMGDDVLYAAAQSNGGSIVLRYDIKTKKLETLGSVDEGIGSFDVVNNKMVYVKTMVSDPFDLYSADGYAKNEKRLSAFNFDWVKQKNIVLPEKHTFTNEKGLTVEYWVMKPANYTPGKKYPLLLEIHGGPSAMWGPGESSMWHEFQFWCSKGYGVVYSNPRGSGGYGYDFLKANVNDWGNGPMTDVLSALDKTVAEGWADPSRLFVTGGSYAGYLIGYILGHDKRFAAACSQRGVYDLRTFFGEGNAWRLVPNYFGGYPWEKQVLDILERESPISYVQNITTPYIIFHGENDLRTGVIQSEQMYKSLKVLGRPVEYVRHPGATHEITRSGNNRQRMDQMLRTWEFFERYMTK
ncbi:S9 family peptidase [Flavihumibacter rivuli]|uniref:S9 family peptidase n=1 Tax=Flavihumibacter rivuli TaxID=2838156 RepID=UPI001BDE68F8|nr:S9 family peptidase [Flavihumibacter rivuli]ULQ55507.1 S9 family peptidase [Flavihumibacter rivuli]